MSKKSSTSHANHNKKSLQQFEQISFEITTEKKERKVNDFIIPSYIGKQMALPNTQRKTNAYNNNFNNSNNTISTGYKVSQTTTKYRQLLMRLDETEQKLVVSQKKYGELWRKYQAQCQTVKILNKQLKQFKQMKQIKQSSSKSSLLQKHDLTQQKQSLLSFQQLKIKYELLQRQSEQYLTRLKHKQHQHNQLQQKLHKLATQHRRVSQQLQQRQNQILKLNQTLIDNERMINRMELELMANNDVKYKSYERIITTLKKEVQGLHVELKEKVREVENVQRFIQSEGGNHHIVNNNNRQQQQQQQNKSLSISTLQQQLSRLHRQKLSIISSYQQKITKIQYKHKQQLRQVQKQMKQKLQQQMVKSMGYKVSKQQVQIQLMKERSVNSQTVDKLQGENIKQARQLQYYIQINKQLQHQLNSMIKQQQQQQQQSSSLLDRQNNNNQQQQNNNNQQQSEQQLTEILAQLQSIKSQLNCIKRQLQHKTQLLSTTIIEKDKLFEDALKLQNINKELSNKLIQNDRVFKQNIQHLLNKLNINEQQKQTIQRQLLAERLQTFKLKQQLQQLQANLKKQYHLSLQNLKTQLIKQIKSANQVKNNQIKQKQNIYIQLKQLEKKYQLLTTQMLTVDDMMSIATKVHKRHSHYVRK